MNHTEEFRRRVAEREAVIGVIGLGYVGLPLSVEFARGGFHTIGFDRSEHVVSTLRSGQSHIQDVSDDVVTAALATGQLELTTDASALATCDAVLICVPTPLSKIKEPDLTYVVAATRTVKEILHPGLLVVLESTTYPGTTRDILLPMLSESGLRVGSDVFLCFSPERVDPGNPTWHTRNTPKVIGGATAACLEVGTMLYRDVFDAVVPVSALEVAELTKVYENTFRMINIALANELAQVCHRLGVDVWEVIDAAATKPFGFMKFVPGPGIGGHCIPLDPHYLSWRMRAFAYETRMIEVASEINAEMPAFVVSRISDALNDEAKPVRGSYVLVLGVTYKRGVADIRESVAFEIMHLLQVKGADVAYHDPLYPVIDDLHAPFPGLPMCGVDLTEEVLEQADAVVIITDHPQIDYQRLADTARLVVDTRGVMRGINGSARIVGLSSGERLPG